MKHNPDNLTDEQIGVADGWRLLDKDEVGDFANKPVAESWAREDCSWIGMATGYKKFVTYRTRLTRAELRKARGLEPEQPPPNPAGPAASQQPTEGMPMSALCFSGRHSGCRGDNGYGEKCGCDCHKQPAEPPSEKACVGGPKIRDTRMKLGPKTQQPAEAVSEAAREATETFCLSERLCALIQRAITAAQQAEISALREEVAQLEQHKGWVVDALRAELATTREQLTKSEQRLIECVASNANEIATLRSQLQEAKRLNGELARALEDKRQKYGKIDADIRQAVRATGFCEIEGSTVGLVERICDLATQRVKELEELRAARRKEVRITFDKIEGSFSVTFGRTGQTVKFEKPKHVAGNVENWLANLRHAED